MFLVKLTSLQKAQIIKQMQWFPLKFDSFGSHLECLAAKGLAEMSPYLWLFGRGTFSESQTWIYLSCFWI